MFNKFIFIMKRNVNELSESNWKMRLNEIIKSQVLKMKMISRKKFNK